MEASNLFKTLKELNEKIQGSALQGHFTSAIQNLTKLTQQAQTTVQNRQQLLTPIENARREIFSAINTFIPTTLSIEESKIYEALGAYQLFGYEGQQRMNQIFSTIQSNPKNTQTQLQLYLADINKITQLYNSFTLFADKLSIDKTSEEKKDSIVIFFQGGVEINNLDELAKVSSKWNQNLIAFALLAKENDRTFRIETVERGSIILTLSAIAGVVYAFAKALDKVLDVIKKYYEIKKIAYDAKMLKGGVPEKTIHELEAASKLKVKTETAEITSQLIEEYGWNADGEEQRRDVDTAVRIAVKHLLEFVNQGGKVDIKLLAQNEQNKEVEMNLTLKYSEIKQIENQVSSGDGGKQILELTDKDPEDSTP